MRRVISISISIAGLFAAPALAGNPYVVRLLGQSSFGAGHDSSPGDFLAAGDLLFFFAETSAGYEPWRTDGTPEGTILLADLCPGNCRNEIEGAGTVGDRALYFVPRVGSSTEQLWVSDGTRAGSLFLLSDLRSFPGPRVLGSLDDQRLLFLGEAAGDEGLWVTDGTPEGTHLLQPFVDFHSFVPEWTAVEGGFLIVTDDGSSGRELWRTDGTPAGTLPLDLRPGPQGSHPDLVARTGDGTVFFLADGEAGNGLWKTDGTPEGTVFVHDLGGTPFPNAPTHFTAVGDRLFFIHRSPSTVRGLWVSDGTAAGTFPVHPLGQPDLGNTVGRIAGGTDRAWVFAGPNGSRELWVSDGTPAGTVRVATELAVLAIELEPEPISLRAVGELAFFVADDGETGYEPWVSDGTPAGTRRLEDICPGSCSSEPEGFWPLGDHVYFRAGDEVWATDGTEAGTERLLECEGFCSDDPLAWREWRGEVYLTDGKRRLWKTDGTPAGTVLLKDEGEAHPPAVEIGGHLVFVGRDSEHGFEPWRTDGTAAGTRLLADLAAGAGSSAQLLGSATLGGRLLQTASASSDRDRMWASDGTPQGTVDLAGDDPELRGADSISAPIPAGDRAVFAAESGEGLRPLNVWRTDGSPGGTERLTSFTESGSSTRLVRVLGTLDDRVIFIARDSVYRLWVGDGTEDGTFPIATLFSLESQPGGETPDPAVPSGVIRGRLVFSAATSEFGDPRLWHTDGTAAGTRPLGADGLSGGAFTAAGGLLFFRTGTLGLGVTDGTNAGTRELAGPFLDQPAALAAVGTRLFFAARTAGAGEELWTSDGTPGGTRLFADLAPDGSSAPREIRAAGGGRFFFVADDGVHGRELWLSDGTAPGTRLVADLFPGVQGSDPEWLVVAGGRVYFAARHPLRGRELWSSDGTAAGTRLVADLVPGPAPSSPRRLRLAGDRVFFHADDARLGETLWAFALGGAPSATPPAAPTGLAVPITASFDVDLTWHDRALDEAFFVLEQSTPRRTWRPLAFLPPDTEIYEFNPIEREAMSFRVRAENSAGASGWSNEVSARPGPQLHHCEAGETTLCLLGGRFAVRVSWRDQRSGDSGEGRAQPYPGSDRTGTFTFFDPANVELIVKALDGRAVNGAFWSFFGALTDVEYWVTVDDTTRLRRRTYHNTPGEICGVGDTGAFPEAAPASAPAQAARPAQAAGPPRSPVPVPAAAGACQPGPETLCLLGGRLQVEVAWNDHHNGGSGPGRAVPGTDKTGYFWFFGQDNVELVVKALDGTPVNGHLWVFYGALTDVEYTITVTDTETGVPVEYHNPPGEICGGADTTAF